MEEQNYMPFYRRILKQHLDERMLRNNRYSLRAYAKALHINPGHLSHIINGNRTIANVKAIDITQKLQLSEEETQGFIKSVELSNEGIRNYEIDRTIQPLIVGADKSFLFDDLRYSHSLHLCKIKKGPQEIANYLNITLLETERYLNELVSIGCLQKLENQYIYIRPFKTAYKFKAHSVIKFHKTHIAQINTCLDKTVFDERVCRSVTLMLSKKQMANYRILIDEFINILKNKSNNENHSQEEEELYGVSVFLFPWKT